MPSLDILWLKLTWLWSQVETRHLVSFAVILISIIVGYRRIQRIQAGVPQRINARGNRQRNQALRRAQRSKMSITPIAKYLSELTKRSVCLSTSILLTTGENGKLMIPSDVLAVALKLAACCQLFTISRCQKPEQEKQIKGALSDSGLFGAGLKQHRSLFCSKTKGKSAMVRHLAPDLYVDNDQEVIGSLVRYLSDVALVKSSYPSTQPVNLRQKPAICHSLQHYFASPKSSQVSATLPTDSDTSSKEIKSESENQISNPSAQMDFSQKDSSQQSVSNNILS